MSLKFVGTNIIFRKSQKLLRNNYNLMKHKYNAKKFKNKMWT